MHNYIKKFKTEKAANAFNAGGLSHQVQTLKFVAYLHFFFLVLLPALWKLIFQMDIYL